MRRDGLLGYFGCTLGHIVLSPHKQSVEFVAILLVGAKGQDMAFAAYECLEGVTNRCGEVYGFQLYDIGDVAQLTEVTGTQTPQLFSF